VPTAFAFCEVSEQHHRPERIAKGGCGPRIRGPDRAAHWEMVVVERTGLHLKDGRITGLQARRMLHGRRAPQPLPSTRLTSIAPTAPTTPAPMTVAT
jgi:hypothetical protein